MTQKKTKNVLIALLSVLALTMLTLVVCIGFGSAKSVRAESELTPEYKTVMVEGEEKYLYELKVGDTVFGKTLVFPCSINGRFGSDIELSNGWFIYYNDQDPFYYAPDKTSQMYMINAGFGIDSNTFECYPFSAYENDYLSDALMDNENLAPVGEPPALPEAEGVTVVSITNRAPSCGVMYMVDEPIKTENNESNDHVDDEENDKWYDNVSIWLEENTGLTITGTTISTVVVIAVVYNLFFKKKR